MRPGLRISFTNPLVTVPFVSFAFGSKGATIQNAINPIATITDGTSNTTLYSERCGLSKQYYTGYKSDATAIQTGAIWADSDNRITVTGYSADGHTKNGPCVINCNNQQGDIYSFHVVGANVAFADGHVKFLAEATSGSNQLVNLQLSQHEGGGEIVSTD